MNMRLKMTTALTLLVAAFQLWAAPFAAIPRTGSPPVIDGKGDDPCWLNSVELTGFSTPVKLDYAQEQTAFRLLWDDHNLYGLIHCGQKNAGQLPVGGSAKDDPQMWRSNCVELFFVTPEGMSSQIIINTEGTVGDLVHLKTGADDWAWDSGVTVRALKEADRWSVEFAIPRDKLGLKTAQFKFNIVRDNAYADEYSSWSPLAERCWLQPERFGALELAENVPGIQFEGLPELKPHAEFALRLRGGASREDCRITLSYRDQKIVRDVALAAGAGRLEKFEFSLGPLGPTTKNALSMRIDSGKRLAYQFEHAPSGEFIAVYATNTVYGTIFLSPSRPGKIVYNALHTFPGGDPKNGGKLRKDYEIVFDCPAGVIPRDGKMVGPSPRGDGRSLWICPQRFAYSSPDWLSTELLTTLPENAYGEVYYYARWSEGRQKEEKLLFTVVNVKPVEAPKRFMTQIYNFWPGSVEKAKEFRQFGVNTIQHRSYDVELVKALRQAGFFVASGGYFFPGDPQGYHKWPQLDRSARAQDINGNYVTGMKGFQLSPSYRGKHFQEAIAKERAFAKASGINYYAFDMEGYIMPNAKLACFNPETLRRFKEYFAKKFPGKQYLDPREFEKKPEQNAEYHQIWLHFKDYIFADLFLEFKRQLADAVGQSCPKPGVVISEWAFAVPDNDKPIEEAMRGPEFMEAFDFFELDGYSGADRFVREILDRQERIRKNFPTSKTEFLACPSPERLDLNRENKNEYFYSPAPVLPEELKYKIMEAAATGMKGVTAWYLPAFNLRAWKYWCEGIAVVGKIEDIVLDGHRIENLSCDQPLGTLDEVALYNRRTLLCDQPKVLVKGMELGDRAIIAVSEYHDLKPVTVKVKYPGRAPARITDVETGELVAEITPDAPDFKVSLDKRRCRMLLATPHGK